MKLRDAYISVLLLIFSVLTQQTVEAASWMGLSCIFETEVEESSDHAIQLNLQSEFQISGSGGSSAGILLEPFLLIKPLLISTKIVCPTESVELRSRLPFYILYCCLKIAC